MMHGLSLALISLIESNNYLQYQLKLAKSHALAICCFFFFFRHEVTAAVVAEHKVTQIFAILFKNLKFEYFIYSRNVQEI